MRDFSMRVSLQPTSADYFSGVITANVMVGATVGPVLSTSSYVIRSTEDGKFGLSVTSATRERNPSTGDFVPISQEVVKDIWIGAFREIAANFPYCNLITQLILFARETTFTEQHLLNQIKVAMVSSFHAATKINIEHKES